MKTNRRNFLKTLSLSGLPLLAGPATIATDDGPSHSIPSDEAAENPPVNFMSDSVLFSPTDYLEKVAELNKLHPIERDTYGNGGATKSLEDAYAKLTGKEKAIFLPTGTMANQLAIKLLSGDNTKVVVPENSHVYRDEGDAAQAVHNKRLIPVGKSKPFFTLSDLKETFDYIENGEVFKSGLGAVMIENPVRRAEGAYVPIEVIKEISKTCREKGCKLHLDGARLHIASAFSGVSIAEYSSHFDTVYISLYKYLNAPHGAILCGDAALIDKIPHQVKILGGTMYQTWTGSAIALHYLNGLDERWKATAQAMDTLVSELNKSEDIKISKIEFGTNIYIVTLSKKIDVRKMAESLRGDNIQIGKTPDGGVRLQVNESILRVKTEVLAEAFRRSVSEAKR